MRATRKLVHAAAPFLSRLASSERHASSRFGGLLQALRAEIDAEQRHDHVPPPNQHGNGKVGGFTLEHWWDGENTGCVGKDLLFRRRCGGSSSRKEEEVAVSAVLGPVVCVGTDLFPGNVFMKVSVKKEGVGSVVVFDCEVVEDGESSDFDVRRVSCVLAGSSPVGSVCRRHLRSNPKDALQVAFKEYLIDRGINAELTDYLLRCLHETDQKQYVAWLVKYLQRLESMI